MAVVVCPLCDAPLKFDAPKPKDRLRCTTCLGQFSVTAEMIEAVSETVNHGDLILDIAEPTSATPNSLFPAVGDKGKKPVVPKPKKSGGSPQVPLAKVSSKRTDADDDDDAPESNRPTSTYTIQVIACGIGGLVALVMVSYGISSLRSMNATQRNTNPYAPASNALMPPKPVTFPQPKIPAWDSQEHIRRMEQQTNDAMREMERWREEGEIRARQQQSERDERLRQLREQAGGRPTPRGFGGSGVSGRFGGGTGASGFGGGFGGSGPQR